MDKKSNNLNQSNICKFGSNCRHKLNCRLQHSQSDRLKWANESNSDLNVNPGLNQTTPNRQHGSSKLNIDPINDNNQTGIKNQGVCRSFKDGHCKYNDKCRFKHPEPCTTGDKCSQRGCKNSHPNAWCECANHACVKRHAIWCRYENQNSDAQQTGKNSISSCRNQKCEFRHKEQFCAQDSECRLYECKLRHSNLKRLCKLDEKCLDAQCNRLHSSRRAAVCKDGASCTKFESTCILLHPRYHFRQKLNDNSLWDQVINQTQETLKNDRLKSEKIIGNLRSKINEVLKQHDLVVYEIRKKIQDEKYKTQEIFSATSTANKLELIQQSHDEAMNQEKSFLSSIERSFEAYVSQKWTFNIFNNSIKRECYRLGKNRLPALALRCEFDKIMSERQTIVVRGQTGSGKSTQLPQYLAELSLLSTQKKVICTQPRKIAAVSLATRVTSEYAAGIGDPKVGNYVGYQVGGRSLINKKLTIIEYITEEKFLNLILTGKLNYDDLFAVVVDEAHERNINTDVIMGILKQKVADFPHLKVVITSATLDPKIFSKYYNDCSTLEIPGRTYPVDVIYAPPVGNANDMSLLVVEKAIEIHITSLSRFRPATYFAFSPAKTRSKRPN